MNVRRDIQGKPTCTPYYRQLIEHGKMVVAKLFILVLCCAWPEESSVSWYSGDLVVNKARTVWQHLCFTVYRHKGGCAQCMQLQCGSQQQW